MGSGVSGFHSNSTRGDVILLHSILKRVQKPGRYLGCEVHSVRKAVEDVDLRLALAFPDTYEIGFSHLGIQILYEQMNRRENVWAERVYAPWFDMEDELRSLHLPLFSLESKTPLSEFDAIGFTLQHELHASNVLNMLDLGGVPLRARDRSAEAPLVIGGGPLASNPEPYADFFDAFFLGEAEDALDDFLDVLLSLKKRPELSRKERLKRLAALPNLYVPSLYEARYGEDGSFLGTERPSPETPRPVRAVVRDFDRAPYIRTPLVPTVEPVHDRFAVEIQRGCTRGCRFCQAGMIYRPSRQRKPETILELARNGLERTGQETLGLLSLSSGDYAFIRETADALFEEHQPEHISIQLPSLHVTSLNEALVNTLNRERKSGFTLAPEAGTERLRSVINKDYSEEDLFGGLEILFKNGWKHVKLYFMIGLPTETDEDVAAIIDLAKRIRYLGRRYDRGVNITVAVSTFVPKPHTPFQWCEVLATEEIIRRQQWLKRELRASKITFKWHDVVSTQLEAAFSRGDRRLGNVIENAFRDGARFDSWTEKLDLNRWKAAFAKEGLDFDAYIHRPFDGESPLPWSHLDYRVTNDYLWNEYRQALSGARRKNCAVDRCDACGVCDHQTVRREVFVPEAAKGEAPHLESAEPPRPRLRIQAGSCGLRVIRFQFEKRDFSAFLGHLDTMNQIARSFRRSAIRLRYSEGYHPKPKISFSQALPLGVESRTEFFDAEILDQSPISSLVGRLNRNLPHGMKIVDARQISQQSPSLSESIHESEYVFQFDGAPAPSEIARILDAFHEADELPFERMTKKGAVKSLDLKSFVTAIRHDGNRTVTCLLKTEQQGAIKPSEVLAHLFHLSEKEQQAVRLEKTAVRFEIPRKAKPQPYQGHGRRGAMLQAPRRRK